MSGLRIFGIVLIILGVLGLVYGRFSYTRKSHEADLGVAKIELKEKETVDIPTWAGVAAIGAARRCCSSADGDDRTRRNPLHTPAQQDLNCPDRPRDRSPGARLRARGIASPV